MAEPAWAPRFEAYATKLLAPYDCPGLSVGIALNGEPIYFKGFGYRDREQALPLTPETVHGIASCTKSFVCVAIMQLQEAGKLTVHDPVVRYLPAFRTKDAAATNAITIHHLMTHTSGLPPLPTLYHAMIRSMRADLPEEGAWDSVEEIGTYDQMITFMAAYGIELLGPPGTRFSYSNDGYALLGHIVERVSGQSLEAYLQEHLLQPAGMTRSTMDSAKVAAMENVSMLYIAKPREGNPDEQEIMASPGRWETGPMAAAGAMRSTIQDMLRYAEIYRTGGLVEGVRILSRASVEAMMTPHADVGDGLAYGYGLQVTPFYQGVSLVEHGGASKGVASNFTIVTGRGLTGVVLNNLGGTPSAQILLGALNAAMGIPVEARRVERSPYTCPPDLLRHYEGTYPMTEGLGGERIFWVEEGVLKTRTEGGTAPMAATTLTPVGPHQFELTMKENKLSLRFLFNAHGEVYGVHMGLRLHRKRMNEGGAHDGTPACKRSVS